MGDGILNSRGFKKSVDRVKDRESKSDDAARDRGTRFRMTESNRESKEMKRRRCHSIRFCSVSCPGVREMRLSVFVSLCVYSMCEGALCVCVWLC